MKNNLIFSRMVVLVGIVTLTGLTTNIIRTVSPVPIAQALTSCDYYASNTGTSNNLGSSTSPWDLQTALTKTSVITAGKTLCLKGGKYTGRFFSYLSGSPDNLITVKSAPGEWAILDSNISYKLMESMDAISGIDRNTTVPCKFSFGTSLPTQSNLVVDDEVLRIFNYNNGYTTCYRGQNSSSSATTPIVAHNAGALAESDQPTLSVHGSYVMFRNFEITNTKLPRVTPKGRNQTGAHFANSLMPGALDIFAPNSKFINILVQNAGSGISAWNGATNTEIYGNIMYHNGWISPQRGHGHNIYSQNSTVDPTKTKSIRDNILMGGFSAGMQIYGTTNAGPLGGFLIENNLQIDDHDSMYGCSTGKVTKTTLRNNYAYGKDSWYSIDSDSTVQVLGNYELTWGTYGPAKNLRVNGIQSTPPTSGQKEVCLPSNEYGSEWKKVFIYNYDSSKNTYSFNPSCLGLTQNQEYEIYDIQNIKGGPGQTFSPYTSFTFNGSNINLPLNLTTTQQIVGYNPSTVIPTTTTDLANLPTLTHTSNEFNGFLIVPKGSFGNYSISTPPAPITSIIPNPIITNITTNPQRVVAMTSWTTDKPTDSFIEYGTSTNYGKNKSIMNNDTNHKINLTELTPGTTYHYRITSKDSNGNKSTSPDQTFTTLNRLTKPPAPTNLRASPGSINLSWDSINYDLCQSIKIYRNISGFIQTPDAGILITELPCSSTSYHDTAVTSGTLYYYSVFTFDDQNTYSDPITISFVAVNENTSGGSGVSNSGSSGGGGGGGSNKNNIKNGKVAYSINTDPVNNFSGCIGNTGFSTTTGKTCTGNSVNNGKYNFGTALLKNGSRGEAVKELQRFLNANLKLGLIIDGILGPRTIAVIKTWQKNKGLVPDGLIGNKTKAMMNATGI